MTRRAAARLRVALPAQRPRSPHALERRAGVRATATDRRDGTIAAAPLRSTIADGVGLYWRYEKAAAAPAKAPSARRSAPPARSTRCAARSGARCRPTRSSTTCWRRCASVLAGYRVVFNEQARAFDRAAAGRGRRSAPQGPDARRQLPDPRARAAAAAAVAQPGVAAVPVAQARDGCWCPTRCSRSSSRASC